MNMVVDGQVELVISGQDVMDGWWWCLGWTGDMTCLNMGQTGQEDRDRRMEMAIMGMVVGDMYSIMK